MRTFLRAHSELLRDGLLSVLIVFVLTATGSVIVSCAHADWTTEICGFGDPSAYQVAPASGNRTFLIHLPAGRKLVVAFFDAHNGICVTTRPFGPGEPAGASRADTQSWFPRAPREWRGTCPESVEIDEKK